MISLLKYCCFDRLDVVDLFEQYCFVSNNVVEIIDDYIVVDFCIYEELIVVVVSCE